MTSYQWLQPARLYLYYIWVRDFPAERSLKGQKINKCHKLVRETAANWDCPRKYISSFLDTFSKAFPTLQNICSNEQRIWTWHLNLVYVGQAELAWMVWNGSKLLPKLDEKCVLLACPYGDVQKIPPTSCKSCKQMTSSYNSRGYILNLTGFERDFSGKNLPSFSLSSVCGTGLRKTRAGTHSVPRNASSKACSWALVQGQLVWDKHPRLLWEEKVTAMKKETCGLTIQASGIPNGTSQLALYPQLLLH